MAEEQQIDYKAEYEKAMEQLKHKEQILENMSKERRRLQNREYNDKEYNKRVKILECMEYLARSINDEDYIEDWLMNGVPDDGTEEDIREMARDADSFLCAVSSFLRVMKYSSSVYDYYPFSHWGSDDWYGKTYKHKDLYSEDIYGHKLAANKFTVKVHKPGCNMTWRLSEEDVDKVYELLTTMDEVDESKLEEEE